jgi:hypothetical protein
MNISPSCLRGITIVIDLGGVVGLELLPGIS